MASAGIDALGKALALAYSDREEIGQVVQIHLFAIRNAEALKSVSLPAVLSSAGIADSYKTELRKGINLAPFVEARS